MKAVILAGGSGTRLWPLSRKHYPKQFLKIQGAPSLLQDTVHRVTQLTSVADVVIVTNADYQFHVRADITEVLGPNHAAQMLIEPYSRDTAPAIALAAAFCLQHTQAQREDILFVAPSDHVLTPTAGFIHHLQRAQEIAAEGYIVTLGIPPREASTAYGYIETAERLGADYSKVRTFTEKPDAHTARQYVASGQYYWNSGMFVFQIGVLLDALRQYAPEIFALIEQGYDHAYAHFAEMPTISIDYAIMEHSDRLAMLPLHVYWNDVGSWDSLFDLMGRDHDGNLTLGDTITVDTHDTLVMADQRLIATIGVSDLVIVETDDAILVARRGHAQQVKAVVGQLRQAQRQEADHHLTTHRPWGYYTILERGERYLIKRMVVDPGQQLSLQLHHHRSEHWVVVQGTAQVTVGTQQQHIHENESMYVPPSTPHRLANPGETPLEIIEVQNGTYLGEDDIVRLEDAYGRDTVDTPPAGTARDPQ